MHAARWLSVPREDAWAGQSLQQSAACPLRSWLSRSHAPAVQLPAVHCQGARGTHLRDKAHDSRVVLQPVWLAVDPDAASALAVAGPAGQCIHQRGLACPQQPKDIRACLMQAKSCSEWVPSCQAPTGSAARTHEPAWGVAALGSRRAPAPEGPMMAARQAARSCPVTPASTSLPEERRRRPSPSKSTCSAVLRKIWLPQVGSNPAGLPSETGAAAVAFVCNGASVRRAGCSPCEAGCTTCDTPC